MLRIMIGLLALLTCAVPAYAQAAKGVDKQSERVRDGGSDRTPANNGNKTDLGPDEVLTLAAGALPRRSRSRIRFA